MLHFLCSWKLQHLGRSADIGRLRSETQRRISKLILIAYGVLLKTCLSHELDDIDKDLIGGWLV